MKTQLIALLATCLLTACHKEQISISSDADDLFYLQNKGVSMPIRVHGNTASKVIMLMVHGGPGGDAVIYRSSFVKEHVEPVFAVAYWDQRNGGASQGGANRSYDRLEDFVEDFEKVVTLLQYRYGEDISIFVNGHSWGGFLTPAFLQKGNNQQHVKGWIQSAGAHDIPLLNELSVRMMLMKAELEINAGRNVASWTEIREFCEPLSFPLTAEQGRRVNEYAAAAHALTPELPSGFIAPGDINKTYIENHAPLLQITLGYNPVPAALASWLFEGQQVSGGMSGIQIPTLLLYGKWDYICPPELADDIEQRIQSSYKKKVIFENSGHGLMAGADKEAYWREVIDFMEAFK